MTTLAEIITRLERATGPDRQIDQAIAIWVGNFSRTDGHTVIGVANCSEYTRSLDAAAALRKRVLPGKAWIAGEVRNLPKEPLGGAVIFDGPHGDCEEMAVAEGATPELALCLAICRAVTAREPRP